MSPEEHNKYLGMAHVTYGVLHILLAVVTGAFVFLMMGLVTFNGSRSDGPPASFMVVILAFVIVVNALFAIPSFVAGYAFLKIPFGTAVSIYTFWFLFSTPGKVLYDNLPRALPPAPPADWNEANRTRGKETYAPPASPPDWR